jgi:hypothetical protein
MSSDTLHTIEEILRDLLIFAGAMVLLLIVLLVVISMLPAENPLKRVPTALSYRVAATAAPELWRSPSSRYRASMRSTTSAFRSFSSGTGSSFSKT